MIMTKLEIKVTEARANLQIEMRIRGKQKMIATCTPAQKLLVDRRH